MEKNPLPIGLHVLMLRSLKESLTRAQQELKDAQGELEPKKEAYLAAQRIVDEKQTDIEGYLALIEQQERDTRTLDSTDSSPANSKIDETEIKPDGAESATTTENIPEVDEPKNQEVKLDNNLKDNETKGHGGKRNRYPIDPKIIILDIVAETGYMLTRDQIWAKLNEVFGVEVASKSLKNYVWELAKPDVKKLHRYERYGREEPLYGLYRWFENGELPNRLPPNSQSGYRQVLTVH